MVETTLYCNDCLEVLRGLPDRSVDLVLTDIPYDGVNMASNGLRLLDRGNADTLTFDLERFVLELNRICSGSMYIFCGWGQISFLCESLKTLGWSTRIIVWEKTNPSPMNGEHIWLSGVEFAVFARQKGAVFNAHCRNAVLRYPSGSSKVHPTEKPIDLFADLLLVSSEEGGVVLDPCMGSGTAGVASAKYNRNFIGIELNPEYYKIAEKRINAAKSQLSLF